MFDLPSSTTTASVAEVEMFPYCRAAPTTAPPEIRIASCGTVTLARSSSVILSAGFSSVFAIGSLSWVCWSILLRLRGLRRALDSSPGVRQTWGSLRQHPLIPALTSPDFRLAQLQNVFILRESSHHGTTGRADARPKEFMRNKPQRYQS